MTQTPKQFYRYLADDYDEMTDFQNRLNSDIKVITSLHKYNFRTVLDAACGTGLHAILLARAGLTVTASDLSAEMLGKARSHARAEGVTVSWVQSSLEKLDQNISETFDGILCLGNSIPHLITKNRLYVTFRNFYQLLTDQGTVIIQVLNYEKILRERKRIIGIRRRGNVLYIRFYDFLTKKIRFNILILQSLEGEISHTIHSTELSPYTHHHLQEALQKTGFSKIEFYGDMNFGSYDPARSQNLVVVAQKPDSG